MKQPSEDRAERWLHEITDAIIVAGRDPAAWQEIPARVAEGWPGSRVLLHGGPVGAVPCLGLIHHGFEATTIARYEEHYCHLNPWNSEWRRHPVLEAVTSNGALPWPTFAGTEFYDDFFKPIGDIDCAAGIKLFDRPGRSAWLGLHYGRGVADVYDRLLPVFLRRLAPVLQAALSLGRDLDLGRLVMSSNGAILEAMSVPAVIVDRRGVTHAANSLASALLDRGRILKLDGSGCLRLSDDRASTEFVAALGRICRHGEAGREEVVIRDRDGGAIAFLSLYPVDTRAAGEADFAWLFGPQRLVLAALQRLDKRSSPSEARLRRLFGFTKVEARLAARLATGESLGDTARSLGMARETARVHLKAVFAKSDTHRQGELVALLAAAVRRV